ncbi:MAG: transferase [Propionivibrio sp.]|nr:transferase [Propionivibrio sp.]
MRFLITTADERSWRFDCPVLFLGEWCRRYDRKHIWSSMDAVVAAPYGLTEAQREKDYSRVIKLFDELLVELADILNIHHGTNHSLRYWRILLGHWLHRFISVIFNRFHTLEKTLKENAVECTSSFDEHFYSLVTQDSLEFIWAYGDDVWNNVLCSKILRFMRSDIRVETLDCLDVSGFEMRRANSPKSSLPSLKKTMANGVRNTLQAMCRKHDAFIINSGLPAAEHIKLQLLLGQVPQIWSGGASWAGKVPSTDDLLRKRLTPDLSGNCGFDQCVRALLFDLLPICYLEGYQKLQDQVRQLPWPSAPRFIFTVDSFDTDEVFKAWTGLRMEEGIPYYTGQHGNNYGTHRYSYSETECVATSDKFLTWGWTDGNAKHLPAFVLTTCGKMERKANSAGGLLLIELHAPGGGGIWDEYEEFQLYQEDQHSFVDKLPNDIQRYLTVRLHGAHKKLPWCDEQRWRDRNPEIELDDGSRPIGKLIESSRLVVHSYDSTGILETLSQNIPTLCFWQGGLSHVRESARSYYEALQRAGIIQSSAESAARKIEEIWNDIPSWWASKEIQSARRKFCGRYAVTTRTPAKSLKRILQEASN